MESEGGSKHSDLSHDIEVMIISQFKEIFFMYLIFTMITIVTFLIEFLMFSMLKNLISHQASFIQERVINSHTEANKTKHVFKRQNL